MRTSLRAPTPRIESSSRRTSATSPNSRGAVDVHDGVVLLEGGLDFAGRRLAVERAITAIELHYEAHQEMINLVLWVEREQCRIEAVPRDRGT
jgi:hypothetical protein